MNSPEVRMVMRGAPALLALLLMELGCTGEESFELPPVEAGAPDDRNQVACAAWAESSCAYDERCTGAIDSIWRDLGTCVARQTLACELAAGDPNVSFDESRVRDCQFPNDCVSARPTCWPPGQTPGGFPCLWDQACQGGLCLGGASFGVCGVCLCDAGCPPGQTCQATSAAGTCVPSAQPVDTPCASSSDCAGGLCDATGLCRMIPGAPFGGSCGSPVDGGAFTKCTGFATCVGGTCIAPAQDGERCDPYQGIGCVWPAQCIESHCVFPTIADCAP